MNEWKAPDRSTVSTFIVVRGADEVVDFLIAVFDAVMIGEALRRSDGTLWNAELSIAGSTVMIGEASDNTMVRPGFAYVHVADCDATFARALERGARAIMEPADRFYGDRDGGVEDMAGNWWWIATHRRDLSPQEIRRAARKEEDRRKASS